MKRRRAQISGTLQVTGAVRGSRKLVCGSGVAADGFGCRKARLVAKLMRDLVAIWGLRVDDTRGGRGKRRGLQGAWRDHWVLLWTIERRNRWQL